MSAPAQKPRPAPVSTMPTTDVSRSAVAMACRSSAIIAPPIAFSRSGRLSVITATGPSTS